MSRIGNAPITIPENVTVTVEKGGRFGNQLVKVAGPKGELEKDVRAPIKVEVNDGVINVKRPNDEKQNKSYHGLYASLISNMVKGVTEGYKIELEIQGIGYRAEQQGNKVVFSLGYAHKIDLDPPAGITVTLPEPTQIVVEGADKEIVGLVAAKIRGFRPPEPYKGKGVRYKGEQILRKSVKKG